MIRKIIGMIADKKLESLGFKKTEDDDCIVEYTRLNERFKYTQKLAIVNKEYTCSIIQSYDEDLFDQKGIGNTCVGLTCEEAEAAVMKLKSKGWK